MHGKYKVLAFSALLNPDISLHPSEGTTTQGKESRPSPDTLSASEERPNVVRTRFQNTLEVVLQGLAHLGAIYTRIQESEHARRQSITTCFAKRTSMNSKLTWISAYGARGKTPS